MCYNFANFRELTFINIEALWFLVQHYSQLLLARPLVNSSFYCLQYNNVRIYRYETIGLLVQFFTN